MEEDETLTVNMIEVFEKAKRKAANKENLNVDMIEVYEKAKID